MRKALFGLVLLATLVCFGAAGAETYKYEDFTYELNEDGRAVLVSYDGPEGAVIIPNTFDGHPVVGVKGNPFCGEYVDSPYKTCEVTVARDHPYLATIDGVLFGKTDRRLIYCPSSLSGEYVIPQGIVTIGDHAFYRCIGLTSVAIPDSVTSIGIHAFYGCTGLTGVAIPDSVTSIGIHAFHGCTGLTGVTIPDSVTSIGDGAFRGCTGLTSVTIPDSVTSIEYCAFYNCTGLTSVTIPDSVTSIGDFAFNGCTGLTSVTIPDSVTSIGDYAFSGCTGLTGVTIPDSVTSIGVGAFANCGALTEIVVSDSHAAYTVIDGVLFDQESGTLVCYPAGSPGTQYAVPDWTQRIGIRAFSGCAGLTGVTIPDSVTSIGKFAFYGCTGLTGITIPDSVTSIGDHAFCECTGLTSVTIPDSVTSIGDCAFFYCTSLTDVTIPDSVTSIGASAFNGCTRLTSVTIPDSVTSIGGYAFYNCIRLTSVTIPDSVTSIGNGAFHTLLHSSYYDPLPNLTFIVPHGSYAERYCRDNGFPYAVDPAFSYNVLEDGTAEITGYYGGETRVVIPDEISGHRVTGLVAGAFDGHGQITALEIPDSVISLGGSRLPDRALATATDCAEAVCVTETVEGAAETVTETVEGVAETVTETVEDADTGGSWSVPEPSPIPKPPVTYTSGPFRGCSLDLVVTVGRGSYGARYCTENGIPFVYREEDYSEDPSDWLN